VDVVAVRGAEITRGEPPGHWNAIFLKDVEPLDTEKYMDAIEAAVDQGGFVFWNHPGWKQPNRKSVWYDEQDAVYQRGWLHGVEVVNGNTYDPIAHRWCLEKKLTMMGNSDVHNPIDMNYGPSPLIPRPLTLVFASEKSADAIREALRARRTVVHSDNRLIGEEQYLQPLFQNSIEILKPTITVSGKGSVRVQIRNRSVMDFELERDGEVDGLSLPGKVTLYGGKVSLLTIRGTGSDLRGQRRVELPYRVTNVYAAPNEGMLTRLPLEVTFRE